MLDDFIEAEEAHFIKLSMKSVPDAHRFPALGRERNKSHHHGSEQMHTH
jgi:hypothetical protein